MRSRRDSICHLWTCKH